MISIITATQLMIIKMDPTGIAEYAHPMEMFIAGEV
jgi:hypothetical protein